MKLIKLEDNCNELTIKFNKKELIYIIHGLEDYYDNCVKCFKNTNSNYTKEKMNFISKMLNNLNLLCKQNYKGY